MILGTENFCLDDQLDLNFVLEYLLYPCHGLVDLQIVRKKYVLGERIK